MNQRPAPANNALSFTAVFLKCDHEYVGFVEELPNVNCSGHTLDEARHMLQELITVVFDERRRETRELIGSKECVREQILILLPRKSARA